MEQHSKRKSKYALILVREKDDGTIKKHTISSAVVEVTAAVLFLLVVAVVCRFVYDSITIKDARKEIVNQIVAINNLTDENEALSVENSTLSSKVAVLSETVSKKTEVEDAISQETVENAMPKGFPLSGSATMKEAEEGDPMLIFTASNDVNVITTGTGTVVSVDADEVYGTRIVIDHGNGYQSVYRNNGAALVKNGEELGKGYILFSVKDDNQELGYQIIQNDEYIDPMILIDING
ncbi:MAG: M23 family metallopeptidase [Lachnospiraceae bacterium]|nr:M23 family metallopeptidase [Lachnospiraceae bacterium]